MFIIFNKKKIYSYLVSLSTVAVLFAIAFTVTTEQSITTATNAIEQTTYNSEEISITIDEEWNESNVENVLQMLEDTNTKANFIMSQEWEKKFQELTTKITQAGHKISIKNE